MRQTPVTIGKDFSGAFKGNNDLLGCDWLAEHFPCHIIDHEIAAHTVKILNRITLHFLIHSWDKAEIRNNPAQQHHVYCLMWEMLISF